MNLTPAERALIDMLRGEVVPTFTISITRTDDLCIVTTSNPDDGVIIGAGLDFDAAYLSTCGVEPTADQLPSGAPAGPLH